MSETQTTMPPRRRATPWVDYRAVWRWHFYAGLFCIPFVMWLAATGAIYLFKPQIETWLDRPYDHLQATADRLPPSAHVAAALAAVPGARLNSYELPRHPDSSVRVLVGRGKELYRAYVHPGTAQVLNLVREDRRPMRLLFYLHGELLLGARGSMLVELAASWAIVLILTGLFLWWPRKHRGLAGVLYPRLWRGGRVFWRDLHAVTGLWVSFFTLFLLLSGLPWAKSWGNLLKTARRVGGQTVARLDWTTGRESELAEREAMNAPPAPDAGEHAAHGGASERVGGPPGGGYAPIDRLVATIAPLNLAPPVLISPPSQAARQWTARSDAPNRPLRTNIVLDAASGAIVSRVDFSGRPLIDRIVGVGVAAHEGQLFGIVNQLVGLFTAVGLWAICVSAVALWWQRRPAAVLGAPNLPARSRVPALVFALVVGLGLVFPMMGLSLIAVLALEFAVLRRIARTSRFLGLSAA